MFKPVTSQPNLPETENKILSFWEENKIFKKSMENRKGNEEFIFYSPELYDRIIGEGSRIGGV